MNEQDEILKQEANISKIDTVALLFKYKKTIQQQKQNECAKLLKKLWSGIRPTSNFHFFGYSSKIYSTYTYFFKFFPVSSSMGNKMSFRKKYRVTGSLFKIDAITGKKVSQVCCYATKQCNLDL